MIEILVPNILYFWYENIYYILKFYFIIIAFKTDDLTHHDGFKIYYFIIISVWLQTISPVKGAYIDRSSLSVSQSRLLKESIINWRLYTQQKFVSHSSGYWKSKISTAAFWWGPASRLQTATFSLCPHGLTGRWGENELVLCFLPRRMLMAFRKAPPWWPNSLPKTPCPKPSH